MGSFRSLSEAMLFVVLWPFVTSAHPGHTDPVLAELNDYLMALQAMRADDPGAAAIFETWRELRAASWKIRKLTDEEGPLINDEVQKQEVLAVNRSGIH